MSKEYRAAPVRLGCGPKIIEGVEQYLQEERDWREEGVSSNSSPFELNWHKSQFRLTLAQQNSRAASADPGVKTCKGPTLHPAEHSTTTAGLPA